MDALQNNVMQAKYGSWRDDSTAPDVPNAEHSSSTE
jgi:hypothetical protein